MSGVTFDSVSKHFGDVVAVDGFSLDVADGEFMVLLGPSGCGKSTALRMIAGLEEVTEGYLSIGERVVNHIPPKERDIAMVFQSYALYPHMTVRKNVESPLVANRATKVAKDEREERIQEAADILDLGEYLDRKPAELSGGQRQRVALARAIVRRPEVFLMDEPLSNLDAKLRTQTRLEIVELHRRLGTTFVYVTHDQVEAMTMADRIAVIHEGRVQQVGKPQEVYDDPANLFVAKFIGSPPMNTISGSISRSGDASLVATEVGSVLLDRANSAPAEALSDGSDVVMGIRPEHLSVGETAGVENALRGTVLARELLGHELHLIVQVGSERFVARHSADSSASSGVGDEVSLSPRRGQIHLFDAATTHRLKVDAANDG